MYQEVSPFQNEQLASNKFKLITFLPFSMMQAQQTSKIPIQDPAIKKQNKNNLLFQPKLTSVSLFKISAFDKTKSM